ncbi:hypothetical protein ACFPIJ_28965 [Dactylosporangium cerinum]|uniref:Transposase n=1 Tax=Dactylosporangium cerinum TaxID=1434730 RepID=A0ABV9W2R7_9ACTN
MIEWFADRDPAEACNLFGLLIRVEERLRQQLGQVPRGRCQLPLPVGSDRSTLSPETKEVAMNGQRIIVEYSGSKEVSIPWNRGGLRYAAWVSRAGPRQSR